MIKIILFIASNIANMLIIYFAEDKSIEANLRVYAISSALVSFTYTFLYSESENEFYIKSINAITVVVFLASILNSNEKWLLWAAYPACVVAAEFASSQVIRNKIENLSRLTTIGILLLFVFGIHSEKIMLIRMAAAAATILYAQILIDKKYIKLMITQPLKYFILIYLSYTGSQLAYTQMFNGAILKIWFLVNQIGIGMYLKLLDFKTRNYGFSMPLKKLILGVVFLLGCGAVFLTKEMHGIIVYFIAIILIWTADSLVTTKGK